VALQPVFFMLRGFRHASEISRWRSCFKRD
jgi:hypothetical protein